MKHSCLTTQCRFVISLCALVKPSHDTPRNLCHQCGYFYDDPIIHIISSCSSINSTRDKFWCDIINIGPIDFSVTLHGMDNTTQALTILSCDSDRFFELSHDESECFAINCVQYIYRMCKDFDK